MALLLSTSSAKTDTYDAHLICIFLADRPGITANESTFGVQNKGEGNVLPLGAVSQTRQALGEVDPV